nr:hypothetical protein [Tanacetum cinerariifolium]
MNRNQVTIRTMMYPDVHPPSPKQSEEVCQAKEDLINSIQTFLDKFDCIPFKERPKIYLQTWYNFFKFRHAKPEDSNELFQKLLKDLKELAEYNNSPSRDRPIFLNNNENHSDQNKEYLENPFKEIDVSNPNQEKEEPPQDFDIHKLIEECCVEASEEQKQSMEDTMLELVKIFQENEFLCIHDNVDDLIESALNSKLLLINANSQLAPILPTKEPKHSLSIRYEHLSITPETTSDDVTESNAENLYQSQVNASELAHVNPEIPKFDFDFEEEIRLIESLLYDNSSPRPPEELNAEIADTIVESIPSLPILVQDGNSQREEIDTVTEMDDILPPNVENDDDSSNDPFLEEADLFLFDNSIPPGIENSGDDPEGEIRFLEELLIDDSILSHESSYSNFLDNPSIPRPPPEPPDTKTDAGKEIPVVMTDKDEFDDDYFTFMIVIRIFLPYASDFSLGWNFHLLSKDCAQFAKNQPKTEQYQHKNGNQKKKPDQKAVECEVTSKDEIECDVPDKDNCSPAFTTFSNPLFNDNDDLDSSDNESLPDEDVLADEFKVYSNPLFNEDEINSDKLDPHCFNVESDCVQSLLNRDTFIDFSSKFDFSGELAHVNPEIPKFDFDFEEEIRLIKSLLYDNSSPRPPEELNAEIADTIVEFIPSLPILVQDGNSQREEIDIVTETDDILPLNVENDDDSSNDPLLEEADLFLFDNSIPPGTENSADDPKGEIRFWKNYLSMIPFFLMSHLTLILRITRQFHDLLRNRQMLKLM